MGTQDPTWLPWRWESALESGQRDQLLLWPTGEEGHMHGHSLAFLWQEIIMFTLRDERSEYGLPKHLSPHKPSVHGGYCKSHELCEDGGFCLSGLLSRRQGLEQLSHRHCIFSRVDSHVPILHPNALPMSMCAYLHPNALPYVRMYLWDIQMPFPEYSPS